MTTDATTAEVITDLSDGKDVIATDDTVTSSPATADEQLNNTGIVKDDDPDGYQKRMNKVIAEKYQEQRAKEALEAENKALKEKALQVTSTIAEELTAPELPEDMFDETALREYHKKTASYNLKVAQETAEKAAQKSFEQRQEDDVQRQRKQNQTKSIQSYIENGLADGLSTEQIQQNEQVISASGMKADVGNYIMTDKNAAKIADYLARNPQELNELNKLDPMAAAVHISSKIKVRALSSGGATKAPDPVKPLKGGGAESNDTDDVPGLVIV